MHVISGLKARSELAQCQGQLSNELYPTAVLSSLNSTKETVSICHGSRPLFVLQPDEPFRIKPVLEGSSRTDSKVTWPALPLDFCLGTKGNQVWSFLRQFSVELSAYLTSFSTCSLAFPLNQNYHNAASTFFLLWYFFTTVWAMLYLLVLSAEQPRIENNAQNG
jgi:hypothetical protein